MSRALNEIIAHLRAVSDNPSVSTTLIQTEDLLTLCDAAEGRDRATIESIVTKAIQDFSSPTIGRGDIHGGQRGYILYERDGVPFVVNAVASHLSSRPPTTEENQ